MNSLLLMEWNGKPPLQWDWEDLMMVNATTVNPKKSQATDWEIDGDRGFDSASFNSSGGGSGSGGSGSDLGLASLSKSSKTASINSSSIGEVKAPNFSLKTSDSISEDFNKSEVVKAKPSGSAPEASIGSGEPLLSLKLGKRTYFEDVYAGSTTKTSSISATPPSSVTPPKRSKSSCQAINVPRCQVEGCNLDLLSAKDYHRKHRVCESHSKCPKVVVNGLERRFCQQCSRFHSLSEFDEKKRSCRRRLSDHNARRRKPQQESVQLNSSRLPSVLYDERQQMSFVWNKTPLVNASTSSNLTWEDASSSRFTITKEYVVKPAKIGNIGGQQPVPSNELTNSMPVHHHSSNGLLPSKSKVAAAEAINQGLDETIISSNVDATQDLHRALSLLSTNNTWGSCDPKSGHLEQPLHKNHTSMPQSGSQVLPQGWPGASSEYWRTERQPTDSRVNNSAPHSDGSIYYQEFQLLRVPCETDFYSDQLN